MTERLTWEEIKNKYPNEWVALIDCEYGDEWGDLKQGIVVAHNKNKKDYIDQFKIVMEDLGNPDCASLFTGELKPPKGRGWDSFVNDEKTAIL